MCGGLLRSLVSNEMDVTCAWCEEHKVFATQQEWRESGWEIFIAPQQDDDEGDAIHFCSQDCVRSYQ
jgi:hypothetical protein